MIGLMLKDLIAVKKQGRILILLALFYIVYAFAMKNISMFGMMITLVCTMMSITTLSYDEFYKWDKYALSMPISRKTIVLSKYALAGISDLAGMSVIFPVSILIGLLNNEVNVYEIFLMTLSFGAIAITFISIVLPIFFKFGTEKGRLLMMVIILLPTILAVVVGKMGIQPPSKLTLDRILYAVPIVVAIIVVLSMQISLLIYNKKEF